VSKGRIRQRLSAWANTSHQDARDLREEYADDHLATIEEAPDREIVRLRGTVRTVTLRPRGGVPVLEAELFDGTGTILVVWLGRRRIGGITPGRSLQVQGRLSAHDGARVMYNPRYELLA
jgi:hypothetical protein